MSTSLATRSRPDGWPARHQRWSGLVFLHWRLEPAAVRPLVPADLQLDLFDGAAWVGATHLLAISVPCRSMAGSASRVLSASLAPNSPGNYCLQFVH